MIQGLTFTIHGAPRTKKNHGRRIRRGNRTYSIPSEAYEAWTVEARKSLPAIWRALHHAGITGPITADLNCTALIWRHADVGDAVGYYQGIADWLESVGIIKNDVQIRAWDGSRLLKDAQFPRVEITLDELEPRVKPKRKRSP